jgi:hypothetical protein
MLGPRTAEVFIFCGIFIPILFLGISLINLPNTPTSQNGYVAPSEFHAVDTLSYGDRFNGTVSTSTFAQFKQAGQTYRLWASVTGDCLGVEREAFLGPIILHDGWKDWSTSQGQLVSFNSPILCSGGNAIGNTPPKISLATLDKAWDSSKQVSHFLLSGRAGPPFDIFFSFNATCACSLPSQALKTGFLQFFAGTTFDTLLTSQGAIHQFFSILFFQTPEGFPALLTPLIAIPIDAMIIFLIVSAIAAVIP